MIDDFENRIYNLFNEILRISPERLSDRSCRDDFEEWDSLGHILLVDALSREFTVTISAEEALDMESVADIKRIIQRLVN